MVGLVVVTPLWRVTSLRDLCLPWSAVPQSMRECQLFSVDRTHTQTDIGWVASLSIPSTVFCSEHLAFPSGKCLLQFHVINICLVLKPD